MSSFYKIKITVRWRATFSANYIDYLKSCFSFSQSLLKFPVMAQYIVGLILKNRGFEGYEIYPEIQTMRKKLKKAFQIIYFSLW